MNVLLFQFSVYVMYEKSESQLEYNFFQKQVRIVCTVTGKINLKQKHYFATFIIFI
jgi:hypothetical protein